MVDPIDAKFGEITDALKRGDLDNPDACMMAFLDWCEGEGFDMRWFTKITDKLPERLRLSPVAIGVALDTRRLAETAGSSIENVHVSHWNPKAPFLKPAGDPTAMDIAVGRSNTPSRTLLYKMLEQPYDYTVKLWPISRVPLALKNF